MKRLLYVFGGLGVLVVGMGLWFGYLALTEDTLPPGVVLGGETSTPAAFWKDEELLLSPEGKIATWSKTNGLAIVEELSNTVVRSATKSSDGKGLLLVQKHGSMSVFWWYEENRQPRFLVASRGEVYDVIPAPTQHSALVFQQSDKSERDELLLLDTSRGTLTSIASNIRSASWMPDAAGIIATDRDQSVWYFGIQAGGRVALPELITQSLDAAVVPDRKSELVIARRADRGVSLLTKSFLSGEEHQLGEFATDADPSAVSIVPSLRGVLAILSFAAGEENGDLLFVRLSTGTVEPAGLTARRVTWLDNGGLLVERMQAGAASLLYLEAPGEQASPVDSDQHYQVAT